MQAQELGLNRVKKPIFNTIRLSQFHNSGQNLCIKSYVGLTPQFFPRLQSFWVQKMIKSSSPILVRMRPLEGYIEELSRFSQSLNAKNWFCYLLKCVSVIFLLNIYVSDSTLSEDFKRAVSK